MDGQRGRITTNEKPIAKPDFPLPLVFSPSKMAEMPTKRRWESEPATERAHFYLKGVDEEGRPTYGFVITREPAGRKAANRST
jgi:hypothetical protein